MFKINNKGSSVSICICDFEQVNLCISNVTYSSKISTCLVLWNLNF